MSYLKGYPHCSFCDAGGIASDDCPNCRPKIAGYLKAEIERLRQLVFNLAEHAYQMEMLLYRDSEEWCCSQLVSEAFTETREAAEAAKEE